MITSPDDKKPEEFVEVLKTLESSIRSYRDAQEMGDESTLRDMEVEIPTLMRQAGEMHPDPTVQHAMKQNASIWEKSDVRTRFKMLHPILQGITLLLVTPLALGAGVLFATGALFYGTGQLLAGIGDVFTAGWMTRSTGGRSFGRTSKKKYTTPASKKED